MHGNRELSVHGLPDDFNYGAYLIITIPPADVDLLVRGYTRPHVVDDSHDHGPNINQIVKNNRYTSVDVLSRTIPVNISRSEGGRNQFGAFVLSRANHPLLFDRVEEARKRSWPMFVSRDRRFNVESAVQIELTVQCSELKNCGTCN
eukprot:483313_1